MDITNTITIMTDAEFAPMDSVSLIKTFEESFAMFMQVHPDVYIGSVTAGSNGTCKYVFIVPSTDQEAIEDSREMVELFNLYHETINLRKIR